MKRRGFLRGALVAAATVVAYSPSRQVWATQPGPDTIDLPNLDGELVHTVKESDVPPDVWAQATHHGFFVLLNVAVGGGWPGAPDGTTTPGRPMLVDWVSVQRR